MAGLSETGNKAYSASIESGVELSWGRAWQKKNFVPSPEDWWGSVTAEKYTQH